MMRTDSVGKTENGADSGASPGRAPWKMRASRERNRVLHILAVVRQCLCHAGRGVILAELHSSVAHWWCVLQEHRMYGREADFPRVELALIVTVVVTLVSVRAHQKDRCGSTAKNALKTSTVSTPLFEPAAPSGEREEETDRRCM